MDKLSKSKDIFLLYKNNNTIKNGKILLYRYNLLIKQKILLFADYFTDYIRVIVLLNTIKSYYISKINLI